MNDDNCKEIANVYYIGKARTLSWSVYSSLDCHLEPTQATRIAGPSSSASSEEFINEQNRLISNVIITRLDPSLIMCNNSASPSPQ